MQFSLRMLFASVAAVGIGAALWTAEPSWQVGAVEALLLGWVLGSTAALSVHSKGKTKTFWMGVTTECIWPVVVYLPNVAFNFSSAAEPPFVNIFGPLFLFLIGMSGCFRPVLFAWSFAPIVGLLCVLTHWLLIRPPEPKD